MDNQTAKPNSIRIAIFGGGILGLCSAYYIKQRFIEKYKNSTDDSTPSLEIDILEKAPILGGLASTYDISKWGLNPAEKLDAARSVASSRPEVGLGSATSSGSNEDNEFWPNLEKYYHHFFASDYALQEIIKELGLSDKLKWPEAKMGLYLNNQLITFSTALDIIKFPFLNIFNRIRLGVVSLFLQKYKGGDGFAQVSAIDWCNKYFGKTVTAVMWKPLLKSKFDKHYDKISMQWLRSRILDRSSSRPGPFKNERLGYIDGSIYTLITALIKNLETPNNQADKALVKVSLKTDVDINSFQRQNGQFNITFTKQNQQFDQVYNNVICTISPSSFIKKFNPPKPYTDQLSKIKFLGAICITLILKKSLMPYYWVSINDPSEPFVVVNEHTNYINKAHYKGKRILYLGKYLDPSDPFMNLTQEELLPIIEKFLQKLNPDFNNSWLEHFEITKSQNAQHIVDIEYKPTTPDTGEEGLFYAHFSQIYPHDRGVNYAIDQAKKLSSLINF